MWTSILVIAYFALVSAGRTRIAGGQFTTIQNYPFAAVILYASDSETYLQHCGGTILNSRVILSGAHCFRENNIPAKYRTRLGSSFASGAGFIYTTLQIVNHPSWNPDNFFALQADISLVFTTLNIIYRANSVQPATIAGANYVVPDGASVTALGWGLTSTTGTPSQQLLHVDYVIVDYDTCNQRWFGLLDESMICAGWLGVGGRGQCSRDSGGPLLHNNVVVGVSSVNDGWECGSSFSPNVNMRVSSFYTWLRNNAGFFNIAE